MSKKLSLRKYGKQTKDRCPVCELSNLLCRRGKLVCPVCGFSRDLFHYSKLLSLSKKLKQEEVK